MNQGLALEDLDQDQIYVVYGKEMKDDGAAIIFYDYQDSRQPDGWGWYFTSNNCSTELYFYHPISSDTIIANFCTGQRPCGQCSGVVLALDDYLCWECRT